MGIANICLFAYFCIWKNSLSVCLCINAGRKEIVLPEYYCWLCLHCIGAASLYLPIRMWWMVWLWCTRILIVWSIRIRKVSSKLFFIFLYCKHPVMFKHAWICLIGWFHCWLLSLSVWVHFLPVRYLTSIAGNLHLFCFYINGYITQISFSWFSVCW